jgi:hypothetical protein
MLDFYQRLVRKGRVILSGVLFFSFALFVAPAGADTPIVIGENLTATIDTVGEIDRYTFEAEAGDTLYVLMSTTSGLDPYFRLYAPNGSMVASKAAYSPDDAEMDTNPLPASGTYVLLAEDYGFNDTGEYRIFVQRRNNPHKNTPIGFGENFSAAIDGAGEVDTYTFNALAGDNLYVVMSTTSGLDPYFRVYAPDGSLIASNAAYSPNDSELDINSLPASGTYVLLATDYDFNDTGEYRIFIQRRNNPLVTTPLRFGANLSATVDGVGEVDTYTFDTIEGDVVMVRMTTSSKLDPYFRLYAPDGSLITYKAAYNPGAAEFTSSPLSANGTYVMIAEDYGFDEIGAYNIQLVRIIGTENSLYVTPSQGLSSSGIEGGPFTAANITYTLKNVGSNPIDWNLTKGEDWLDLSKTGGSLAAGATDTVTIAVNTQANTLAANAYFDTLTFTNTTENNLEIFRNVTLLVKTPEGSLVVTPDDVFLSTGPRHGPFLPATMTFTLTNVGDAIMNWKVAKTAHWLNLSAAQGALNSGGTVDIRVDINEAPNDFAWGLYKDRISFINITNGNGDTLRDVELTIEAIPSEITCELSASNLVLGEPLSVSGQITPQPNQSGAFVGITLIAPDASEVHRSVVANALGQFSYAVACDDIHQAGTWTVRTSWSGDEGLYPATSGDQILELSKAESRLTINSTSQALKLDVPVDISGKFTPQPDCGGDLAGRAIELHISGPGGISRTESVVTGNRWGHYVLQDYIGFDALGDWTVEAVFAGDGAYAPSSSELLNVKVVETAGYAVVVQGKISSNEGLASHNKTANFVYDQLIARGLMNDDIMYFNYDDGQPGVDGVPDKSGIQDAITQWAQDKMNVKPANLYLVMVDHGFDDTFYIHPDIITAPELKEWLNTLQEGLIPEAKIQEKIIILGFCRSGSFIDDLSGSYRAVIASAAADESSYKGPLDADGIREGEYFVSEFFKAIAYGKSIAQSFNEAAILTESFTVATDGRRWSQ